VYEGKLLRKKPHGFGRMVYKYENQVKSMVGEFIDGYPNGKIIKFFINPKALERGTELQIEN
jgi:hypothetical protein